jgi:hypothetical protein
VVSAHSFLRLETMVRRAETCFAEGAQSGGEIDAKQLRIPTEVLDINRTSTASASLQRSRASSADSVVTEIQRYHGRRW